MWLGRFEFNPDRPSRPGVAGAWRTGTTAEVRTSWNPDRFGASRQVSPGTGTLQHRHIEKFSKSSVYHSLKEYGLITSPNYIVMSAKDSFTIPTKRVHELWQTDYTYFKVIGWSWYYLCLVLDDYCRYIIAWKLLTTMAASDVKGILDVAIEKTDGCL